MRNTDALFRPFRHGRLELRNRIVMPAMTRNFSPGNIPGDDVLDYYRRRAASIGLVITEGTCVGHPAANAFRDVPFIYGEEALAAWGRIVAAVHAEGCSIVPQLWHTGSARHPGAEPDPSVPAYTPSGLTQKLEPGCHVMSERDIGDVIDAFARAATDARAVGFDGVEIHGAHGYLIDEFFWEQSNRRSDRYGGSLENRSRFAAEIVHAVRRSVGPDFPVLFRWSQWKQQDYGARLVRNAQELERMLGPLCDAGVDIFDCSTRRYWEPEFEGSDLTLAGWTRIVTGRPTITVGSVGLDRDIFGEVPGRYQAARPASLDNLIGRLEAGEFDLVAVGRALVADPDWARKVREGRLDDLEAFDKGKLRALY